MADLGGLMERQVATATESMKATERRAYRIDHGMCPECGKEAAPYYLCFECRKLGSMRRMLTRMADLGIIEKIKRHKGRFDAFKSVESGKRVANFAWNQTLWDMPAEDARRKPRINRRPIDLDETLFGIFREAGHPLQMEEIYEAWGRLRSKRKHGTLAGDMAAIIAARRRREARAEKTRSRHSARLAGVPVKEVSDDLR